MYNNNKMQETSLASGLQLGARGVAEVLTVCGGAPDPGWRLQQMCPAWLWKASQPFALSLGSV